MQTSVWRLWAKGLAYVDLILSCIHLIYLFVEIILAIIASTQPDQTLGGAILQWNNNGTTETMFVYQPGVPYYVTVISWVTIAIFALISGINLWTIIKLLGATEIETTPRDALQRARMWRNAQIIFTTLGIIGLIVLCWISLWALLGLAIWMIWRGAFLFIAYRFMKDCESALAKIVPNQC